MSIKLRGWFKALLVFASFSVGTATCDPEVVIIGNTGDPPSTCINCGM